MLEELKDFCLDVLGDHMEKDAYIVEEDRKGNLRVIVRYEGLVYAPKEMIYEDWKYRTKGTKFENVPLYM